MKPRCRVLFVLAIALLSVSLAAQAAAEGQNDVLKRADAIAADVAKIRGLKQKRPIARGVMQKDQVRKRLLKRIDEEYKPAELAGEELALKRLGLLPPDTDYKKLIIELLTDQIAGFYDPIEQRLYIAGWQTKSLGVFNDMLMAHEIDHALQDQHFNLRQFMKNGKENSDAAVARQALVEGDGTALMVEYMMRNVNKAPWSNNAVLDMMKSQMPSSMGDLVDKAPLAVRESLMFPYMQGLVFVVHFRRNHPWRRIDAIYRKPPLSTEHILHPRKYEVYERPDQITARPIAGLAGYRAIYNNINGEFGFALLLRQHIGKSSEASKTKAELAARGWGGDRLVVYAPPGHRGELDSTVAVSYSVWDHAADAMEFFDVLSDGMGSLSAGKASKSSATHVEYIDSAKRVFVAERKGDAVVLVVGAPPGTGRAILDQVWAGWRVRRR